ncbi:ABC transporter ATP-binding protein [Paenibacillus sanguinis]|uniref:ABC transporter ATP-binding protein n=1 Tax=Paenibacillus sanguinis TaxID=225906 RepID=UPI00036B9F9B|nr:ABC transporter ATP-binding protein [Paenibacillus sanguinis]
MPEMILTQSLIKQYGDKIVIDDISLSVDKGEIYGFLGLNGAGKTTIIRLLLGMVLPSSGSVYLNGQRVVNGDPHLWDHVGYLVETPYAYPSFTVRENLEMMRRLRRLPDKRCIDEVMSKLKLTSYEHTKAKNLSLGNAQKLGLAKALMHNPSILVLDEPTNGLDPAGIYQVRQLLQDLALNHGVTIFISSHILEEMSKMVSRFGIIHQGRLIQEASAADLDRMLNKYLWVDVDTPSQEKAMRMLTQEGYDVRLSEQGGLEIMSEKAIRQPEQIAKLLVHADLSPTLLKVEEENLESYFLRTVGVIGGGCK